MTPEQIKRINPTQTTKALRRQLFTLAFNADPVTRSYAVWQLMRIYPAVNLQLA